jgi:hypothetical protein
MGKYSDELGGVGTEVDSLVAGYDATVAALNQQVLDLQTQLNLSRTASDQLKVEFDAYRASHPDTPAPTPTPTPSLESNLFGMYVAGGLTGIKAIETEYNRKVDVIHVYQAFTNSPPSGWGTYSDRLQISLDMLSGYSFDQIIAGAADAALKAYATKLVAAGMGGILIRLGWEYNGDWMKWALSKTTPTKWRDTFRHIVLTMNSVTGAKLRFLWSVAQGKPMPDPVSYPGDDVVFCVDLDTYAGYGGTSISTAHYNSTASRDSATLGFPPILKFAQLHNKQVSVSEWGCWFKDDPAYIREMISRFNAWGSLLHHQIYFNVLGSTDNIEHRLTTMPLARAAMHVGYALP